MRSSYKADKVGISYNRRKPISHKGALLRLLSSTAGAPSYLILLSALKKQPSAFLLRRVKS